MKFEILQLLIVIFCTALMRIPELRLLPKIVSPLQSKEMLLELIVKQGLSSPEK